MTTSTDIRRLRELIDHAPDCNTDPYRDDDQHDLAAADARFLLHSLDDRSAIDFCNSDAKYELRTLINSLCGNEYAKGFISTLALEFSLCPMHLCDYQACFDDDEPDCAIIREYFPDHDT
jgi:hypothetical protein